MAKSAKHKAKHEVQHEAQYETQNEHIYSMGHCMRGKSGPALLKFS